VTKTKEQSNAATQACPNTKTKNRARRKAPSAKRQELQAERDVRKNQIVEQAKQPHDTYKLGKPNLFQNLSLKSRKKR
jgi:hypothetical protein